MSTTEIRVENVSCGHCTGTIERELGEIAGISSVRAGTDGTVVIEHDDRASLEEIHDLLREINYPPVASGV